MPFPIFIHNSFKLFLFDYIILHSYKEQNIGLKYIIWVNFVFLKQKDIQKKILERL